MARAAETRSDGAGEKDLEAARARLASTGRNDPCPCGSGKKYKKCHLREDESDTVTPETPPDARTLTGEGWRLFEQRRPGAAEKQFRAALERDPGHADAHVGVGMARLSAGDKAEAIAVFRALLERQAGLHQELVRAGTKNGFEKPEAQPLIRAAHALGCVLFDEGVFEESAKVLGKVYEIDAGAIGTEARLVAGKALVKAGRAAEAIAVLRAATAFETARARAEMGLSLAYFSAGDRAEAEAALGRALGHNPHLGKAILGLVRKQVDNPAAALPGTREEAAFYAQSFGDAWDDAAKAFLREALDGRAPARAEAPAQASVES